MGDPLDRPARADVEPLSAVDRPAEPHHGAPGGVAPRGPGRTSRCSTHPGRHAVGSCGGCGRRLCLSCAVPVRGVLVGSECLASYVQDVPVGQQADPPGWANAGDVPALIGYAIVIVASLLPWTRFAGPRPLGAWRLGWALLAPLAGLGGLAAVMLWHRWPLDPRFQSSAVIFLALVAGGGALAYRLNPPLLAGSSLAPLLAIGGALVALAGGLWKAWSTWTG